MTEITTSQAAALLNCTRSNVVRLVREGKLQKKAIHARLWVVYREEVEALTLPGRGAHNHKQNGMEDEGK